MFYTMVLARSSDNDPSHRRQISAAIAVVLYILEVAPFQLRRTGKISNIHHPCRSLNRHVENGSNALLMPIFYASTYYVLTGSIVTKPNNPCKYCTGTLSLRKPYSHDGNPAGRMILHTIEQDYVAVWVFVHIL